MNNSGQNPSPPNGPSVAYDRNAAVIKTPKPSQHPGVA